ncbi:hypothetical protein PSPO01_09719 [Paraphaeosphaeria sporulosa]
MKRLAEIVVFTWLSMSSYRISTRSPTSLPAVTRDPLLYLTVPSDVLNSGATGTAIDVTPSKFARSALESNVQQVNDHSLHVLEHRLSLDVKLDWGCACQCEGTLHAVRFRKETLDVWTDGDTGILAVPGAGELLEDCDIVAVLLEHDAI